MALRSSLAMLRGWFQGSRSAAARPPGLAALLEEARRCDIPVVPWPRPDMIQLGHGARQRRLHAQRSDRTSVLAQELAGSREWTKAVLRDHGVPVPDGSVISTLSRLPAAIRRLGFPAVLKPVDGRQGTVDVGTWLEAVRAFVAARLRSRRVVVERHHRGNDYRLLVVGDRFVAAAMRTAARVVGDGRSTVRQLIEQLNADPRRGHGHENVLARVRLDRSTRRVLRRQGYHLTTVLAPGKGAALRRTASLSMGGTAHDVTTSVHPDTVRLAGRIAQLIGLDIAGIDVVSPDIARPLTENGGVVVEVNAGPGLRMHLAPGEGAARNVAASILDSLFPPGCPARIPIVAVTGTNGKTTTARLVAHLLGARGLCVGSCTTDGIYVDGRRLAKRDAAGPESARAVLREPSVEAAVLEVARGGLLRAGLGFDDCDVGILLNVDADHLGLGGVETVGDLARVKGAVLEAVRPGGLAVVNADDPHACEQAQRTPGRVAYFTLLPESPLVRDHVARGGLAAACDGERVFLLDGVSAHPLGCVDDLPVAFGRRAPFMVANALAASLAAFALGMHAEDIRAALATFAPSSAQNPGRMNLFTCGPIHVLVDYAHNPPALRALSDFVRSWEGERVGVVGMAGDRREQDYLEFGEVAARTFNRVIVYEDGKLRRRPPGEVSTAIVAGLRRAATGCRNEIIRDREAAARQALETAPDGALVVLLAEDVDAFIAEVLARGGPPTPTLTSLPPGW